MSLQTLIEAAEAIGAAGIWLLNDAQVHISYVRPDDHDAFDEFASLDLRGIGRVLIIPLASVDDTALPGLTTLAAMPGYCRVCGCSQFNACEDAAGPCGWIEEDLCSRCVGSEVET